MSWRRLVARREERRVKEDRDVPASMRQGRPDRDTFVVLSLAVGGAAVISKWIYSAWTSGNREFALILAGMAVVAVGIVVGIARSHRASNAKTLRKPPQADSVEWEE